MQNTLTIKMEMKNKKSQTKIQEMAFVLLALTILGGITFIFFTQFQISGIQKAAETIKQHQAISLLEKISAMPELRCSYYGIEKLCIDEDKLKIFQTLASNAMYEKQWQGMQKITVKKIWPSEYEWQIYSKGKGNFTYSTFVSVCRQEFQVTSSWKCSLGLMEVSYNA